MNDAAPASGYAEAYAAWRADPEGWWEAVAEGIAWERRWDRVFDAASGPYGRWFPGAALNTCFNCVDRHVLAGRGEQAALIWDSPMTGRIETFTYRQLQARTAKLAGALAARGVARGDRVVIYLPMVPHPDTPRPMPPGGRTRKPGGRASRRTSAGSGGGTGCSIPRSARTAGGSRAGR